MYGSDYDNKRKLKVGQDYLVTVTTKRNIRFHRKYFALLNLVFQNQEIYNNLDDLRKDLTIAAGFHRERLNIHGEIILEAESINFASMDDIKFSELYSRTIDQIVKYFNFDRQDIINEVEQFF